MRIWRAPSTMRVVYSDASSTGYAGFTVEHGCHIALGQWNAIEAEKSSTWRELTAVARVLEAVMVYRQPECSAYHLCWQ